MASIKLEMEDGKEIAVDDLQPIVIGEHEKVLITIEGGSIPGVRLIDLVGAFNEFFGYSKWMLSASKMQIDIIKDMEVENEQPHI